MCTGAGGDGGGERRRLPRGLRVQAAQTLHPAQTLLPQHLRAIP